MTVTASVLRANIYNLIDQVLDTGEPLVIERRGRRLELVRMAITASEPQVLKPQRKLGRQTRKPTGGQPTTDRKAARTGPSDPSPASSDDWSPGTD